VLACRLATGPDAHGLVTELPGMPGLTYAVLAGARAGRSVRCALSPFPGCAARGTAPAAMARGTSRTVQRYPPGLRDDGVGAGEILAPLKSVPALPAWPSSMHR